jgi:multisubunit Na+/H+ antiporter MnhB subunit
VRADLRRIERRHALLVAAAAGATAALGRPGPGGVLLGGAAIGLSVVLYAVGFRAALARRRPHLAIGILFVKLAALLGVLGLVFAARQQRPDPLGFAVGVSCFVVAAVWEALRVRAGR